MSDYTVDYDSCCGTPEVVTKSILSVHIVWVIANFAILSVLNFTNIFMLDWIWITVVSLLSSFPETILTLNFVSWWYNHQKNGGS